jgi:arabinose-5-phosphate isomerase
MREKSGHSRPAAASREDAMTDRSPEPGSDAMVRATVARVLREEAAALADFADRAGACATAARLIHETAGQLVVAGIGKSGHIGRKIASTFRSLGKPAVFVHAAEASHGDLGLLQPGCAALVLSNSGETTELSDVLHHCRAHDIPVIGVTGREGSALARASRVAIVYGAVREACRNQLAPTTSTTLMLAIGDALAVAVSELMGAAPEDFRRFHPGGRLGARLLTAGQVMRTGDALPLVDPDASMSDVVVVISEKALGVAVLSRGGEIAGIITDGDLRRNAARLWEARPLEIATRDPVRIAPGMLVTDAMDLMSKRKITVCIVEEPEGRIAGILHLHDCLRTGAAD